MANEQKEPIVTRIIGTLILWFIVTPIVMIVAHGVASSVAAYVPAGGQQDDNDNDYDDNYTYDLTCSIGNDNDEGYNNE